MLFINSCKLKIGDTLIILKWVNYFTKPPFINDRLSYSCNENEEVSYTLENLICVWQNLTNSDQYEERSVLFLKYE